MKKLLVLSLVALMVFGISAVSMAAATLSGEVDAGYMGWNVNGTTKSADYLYGKIVLNGKLGDDLTGTIVLKDADTTYSTSQNLNMASFAFDEADVTYTEDWGALKIGYYGWNNNIKDILDVFSEDVKSQANVSYKGTITDNITLGLAYAFTGDDGATTDSWMGAEKNAFGADLGLAADMFGGDLLYYHYNDNASAYGLNAYIKLGDFKPFLQYRNFQNNVGSSFTLVNSIIGFTYDSAAMPLYARAEIELSDKGYWAGSSPVPGPYKYDSTPWGIRVGYKLENGSKVEAQYYNCGYNLATSAGVTNYQSKYYMKVICPF